MQKTSEQIAQTFLFVMKLVHRAHGGEMTFDVLSLCMMRYHMLFTAKAIWESAITHHHALS